MLYYSLLPYLRLHHFNVILLRVSLLMLQYFNASVSDVARFEFALFVVALFTVALRNVAL